jgi:hypothetical protein
MRLATGLPRLAFYLPTAVVLRYHRDLPYLVASTGLAWRSDRWMIQPPPVPRPMNSVLAIAKSHPAAGNNLLDIRYYGGDPEAYAIAIAIVAAFTLVFAVP